MLGFKTKKQKTLEEIRSRPSKTINLGLHEEPFLFDVRAIPHGVMIKRIFHRKGQHNWEWRVSYRAGNGKPLRTVY